MCLDITLKYREGKVCLRIDETSIMCLNMDLCSSLVEIVKLGGKDRISIVYPAGLATSTLFSTWNMFIE